MSTLTVQSGPSTALTEQVSFNGSHAEQVIFVITAHNSPNAGWWAGPISPSVIHIGWEGELMQHINTPLDQHWAWIAGRAAGAIRVGRPSAAQKLARLRSRAKTLPAQSDHGNPIDQLAQVGSFAESIAEAENLQR